MGPEGALDEVDWRLLGELQANARLSYSELGRRIGLSAPAVAERIRRMEQAGVINGYRVDLNLERAGLPVVAIVRMMTRDGQETRLGQLVKGLPEVLECHRVTGGDSYILKIAVRSVDHLESLLDRLVVYGQSVTSIVLSSPVTHRVIRPTEPPQPRPERPAGQRQLGLGKHPQE